MAEVKHAVVRTDNMAGTDVRAEQVSFVFMGAGSSATAIDNGNVVRIEKLKEGNREVMVAKNITDETALGEIALVATPETWYDREHNLEEFVNEAGEICRGYMLHTGDTFSVTAEALSEVPEVGHAVELQAGTKLKVGAGPGTHPIGTVIAIEKAGRHTFYVIKLK